METRICRLCHVEQPLTQFAFTNNSHSGRRLVCRPCRNARSAAWYLANKTEHLARTGAWQKANPEKTRAYGRAHDGRNIVKRRAQHRAWAIANPEKARAAIEAWKKAHPEQEKAYTSQRRARQANAAVNDLTGDQFLEICQAFNFRCAYCPLDCKECKAKTHALQQDHITALAKDGNHTVHNVVPACPSCNFKKHTGAAPVFVQPLLLTIAPSKREKP